MDKFWSGALYQRFILSASVATWASFLSRALPLVIFPPFVFKYFSTEEAALWFLLITLQGLQLLLESSIGLTFVRSIGYAMGGATQMLAGQSTAQAQITVKEDQDFLSRVWSVMMGLYPVIGMLTLVLIGVMGFLSAPVLISKIEVPYEGWISLVLFVLGASLRAYGGLHISYLYGVGKISLLRWWEMLFWLAATVSVIVTFLLGGDLVAVCIAYQVPLIANLVWNALLVRRDQKNQINFVIIKPMDWSLFKDIWPGMWRATLGVFIYIGVVQGAGLFYAQIGSAQDVAIYLFAMSLMRPMMQFAQVPFATKLPRLAALQVKGDRKTQIQVAQRGMILSNMLLALLVVLIAFAFPVIAWASGGDVARVPMILWSIISLASLLERVGAMHLQLYSQTNHILWHWANGGTGLLFVLFTWLLLPYMDNLAIPTSLCLAVLIFYIPFSMRYSYREFKLSFPAFEVKTSVVPMLIILMLLLGSKI